MDDIRLPRHVIDRLEHRWATRLQQDAKAWSSERDKIAPSSACAVLRSARHSRHRQTIPARRGCCAQGRLDRKVSTGDSKGR